MPSKGPWVPYDHADDGGLDDALEWSGSAGQLIQSVARLRFGARGPLACLRSESDLPGSIKW